MSRGWAGRALAIVTGLGLGLLAGIVLSGRVGGVSRARVRRWLRRRQADAG